MFCINFCFVLTCVVFNFVFILLYCISILSFFILFSFIYFYFYFRYYFCVGPKAQTLGPLGPLSIWVQHSHFTGTFLSFLKPILQAQDSTKPNNSQAKPISNQAKPNNSQPLSWAQDPRYLSLRQRPQPCMACFRKASSMHDMPSPTRHPGMRNLLSPASMPRHLTVCFAPPPCPSDQKATCIRPHELAGF